MSNEVPSYGDIRTHRKCASLQLCTHMKTGAVTSATLTPQPPTPHLKIYVQKTKCPACRGRLVKSRAPLECSECRTGFHLKCAPQTGPALEHLRSTHSWTCQTCLSAHDSGTTQKLDGTPQKPRNNLRKLTVMQWNCDYLATKIPELKVVIKKYAVDIILLQETRLGLKDHTFLLGGFDAIRTDSGNSHKKGWKPHYLHQKRPPILGAHNSGTAQQSDGTP